MEKKDYSKPTMRIVQLNRMPQLLVASGIPGSREGYVTETGQIWE